MNNQEFHKALSENLKDYKFKKLFGLEAQGKIEVDSSVLELCGKFVKELSDEISRVLEDKVSTATGGIVSYILAQYANASYNCSDSIGIELFNHYRNNTILVATVKKEGTHDRKEGFS